MPSPTTSPTRTPTATSACASGSRTSCTSAAAGRRRPTTRSSAPARASSTTAAPSSRATSQNTGDPLNVGIEGEGFIKVKLSDGRQALTRDGDLHIDGKGRLVTSFGGFVQPEITIPEGTSSRARSRSARTAPSLAAGQNVGKIALVNVRSPQNLESVGDNAFVTTARSGNAVAAPAATLAQAGRARGLQHRHRRRR